MIHGKLSFGSLSFSLLLAAALSACSAAKQNTADAGGAGGGDTGSTEEGGGAGAGGETGSGGADSGEHFAEWVRVFPFSDVQANSFYFFDVPKRPIATDAVGNVYIGGDVNSSQDFGQGFVECPHSEAICSYVLKLDPSGKTLWQRFFSTDGKTHLSSLAVAGNGIIVGLRWDQRFPDYLKPLDMGDGSTLPPNKQHSMVLARLAPGDGKVSWASAFGSNKLTQSSYSEAVPTVIVPDGDTGFIVAGQFSLPTLELGLGPMLYFTLDTPFVARFDNDKPVWQMSWEGDAAPPPSIDSYPGVQLTGAARLPDGQIAVMGNFNGSLSAGTATLTAPSKAGLLALLDSSGQLKWQKKVDYGADSQGDSELQDIAIDSSGDILLAGVSATSSLSIGEHPVMTPDGKSLFLVKMQPDGTPLWVKTQNEGNALAATVTADASGHIGRGWRSWPGSEPMSPGHSTISSLDANGDELWSIPGDHFVSHSMTFDAKGHLIVMGYMESKLELLPGGPVPSNTGVFVARFAP